MVEGGKRGLVKEEKEEEKGQTIFNQMILPQTQEDIRARQTGNHKQRCSGG